MWRRTNYLGETRKRELLRRLDAIEVHVQDLEERLAENWFNHLQEFHHGQDGFIPEPEGDSDGNEKV